MSPFRCPRCGRVSHHPTDDAEGYCGSCHDFTRAVAEERPFLLSGLQALEDRLADDLLVYGVCYVFRQPDSTVVRQDPTDVVIQFRQAAR